MSVLSSVRGRNDRWKVNRGQDFWFANLMEDAFENCDRKKRTRLFTTVILLR